MSHQLGNFAGNGGVGSNFTIEDTLVSVEDLNLQPAFVDPSRSKSPGNLSQDSQVRGK